MGPGAAGGGIMVSLGFESGEEGREAVFGYWSARLGWCHYGGFARTTEIELS